MATRIVSVLCLGVILLAGAAAAENLSIAAFAGKWEGSAVSENSSSVNFAISTRDMDVEISPAADRSFTITWRTLMRQGGQPDNPDNVEKITTRNYLPGPQNNIWFEDRGGDLFSGETTSWAQLEGQQLNIYSIAMRKTGGYDMHIYRRTLTGLGMKLEFSAIRDGIERRTASGTLIKSGN
jgi:hypothetical protein